MSLRDLGVYGPLDHRYPFDKIPPCWVCERKFKKGDRTCLMNVETPEEAGSLTCEARLAHATCRMRGQRILTPDGARIIKTIHNGDACFPVETTDGKFWSEEQVWLDWKMVGLPASAHDPEPDAERPLGNEDEGQTKLG